MKKLLITLFTLACLTGCGNSDATLDDDDFSGKTFTATLPDTSVVFRETFKTPAERATLKISYVFHSDTTGEMKMTTGVRFQQNPFVWRVDKDSIRMKFNNVDGALYVLKNPTGYQLYNKKFSVFLTEVKQ